MLFQTRSGKVIVLTDPDPMLLNLEDIAHHLSMLCRFNGACTEFYSVAEHSVRVSTACPSELAEWGLMHDAHEAYLGDPSRPLARALGPGFAFWDELRKLFMTRIRQRFGLGLQDPAVKLADDTLLATERRDLMVQTPLDWELPPPLPEKIEPWDIVRAREMFIVRFHELGLSHHATQRAE